MEIEVPGGIIAELVDLEDVQDNWGDYELRGAYAIYKFRRQYYAVEVS